MDVNETRVPPSSEAQPAAGRTEVALLVAPAVILGAIARIVPVVSASFPLNDGGLFYVMSQDLIRAGFLLPDVTSYNNAGIPFAYPPLALYLLAALSAAGLDAIELLRWIPLTVSIATIPLAYVVAKELLGSWRMAAVAALAFALIPRSYEWTITGGGLTRGLGMAFALLAIWQGIRLIRKRSTKHVVLTGLFGGLTLLTHPEASLFVVISLTVIVLAAKQVVRGIGALIAAGVIGIVVAAPWWLTVTLRHGLEVLSGAADSRTIQLPNALRSLLFGDFTGAAAIDIFLGVGLLGLLVELGRRRYMLAAWFVLAAAAIVAGGFTFAAVPWAMLIAIAVIELILPMTGRLTAEGGRVSRIVGAGLTGAAVLATLATGFSVLSPVHALSSSQRDAMSYIRENTPANAVFAVVTGVGWQLDAASEWFPALSGRTSAATVQGYEWTDAYADRAARHQLLQDLCAHQQPECLHEWTNHFGIDVDFIFIPSGKLRGVSSPDDCCPALRQAVREKFEVIYDGSGGTIAEVGPSTSGG